MTISYREFYLLSLLLAIPLLPPSVNFCILLVTFGLYSFPIVHHKMLIFNEIWPLIGLIIVGSISGSLLFFNGGSIYFYLRDGFYFVTPVLAICIGYYAAKSIDGLTNMMRLLVFGAFLSSLVNYSGFIFGLDFLTKGMMESRYEYQLNSGMSVIGFSILYFARAARFKLFTSTTTRALMGFFLMLIIVSLSRTNFAILFMILLLPLVLSRVSAKRQLLFMVPMILLVIFGGALLAFSAPDSVAANFIEKLANSGNEIVVREYESAANINHYWRSYEAFLGLQKYLDGGYLGLAFGQGFGSFVSASHLFDNKFEYIPIFHNGFITILLKTGIFGMFLFFTFLKRVINVPFGGGSNESDRFYALLSNSMMWVVVFNTYFIHGLYTAKINILVLFVLGCVFKRITLHKASLTKRLNT